MAIRVPPAAREKNIWELVDIYLTDANGVFIRTDMKYISNKKIRIFRKYTKNFSSLRK